MKQVLYAATCVAALSGSAGITFAQAADTATGSKTKDIEVEEVVVTATRREEKLQDVPISVTAFSQDELTRKGIVGYEGIAHETPGVVMNRPTQNFNNFTARGIATNGYNANLQSTVAIYIDELPISANGNSTILDPNLYDVERVEFLRGPQGTLFGSGSLAGAMRILTKSPDLDEVEASMLVDMGMSGSDSLRQRYNAMVNVPIVEDELAFRAVVFYRDEDGYVDNLGTGIENSNSLQDVGGRAILLWEPTDKLSVRMLASHENSDPKDSSLVNPALGEELRNSERPDRFMAELNNFNTTVEYQFDWATLTSSSTYSHFDQTFYVDLANTFGFALPFRLDADAYDEIFVQETRLVSETSGPIDWVVGGFYYYKRRDVDFAYKGTEEFFAQRGITGLDGDTYQELYNHTVANELAGFGEVTYHLNDKAWVTGGLRYGSNDVQTITEDGGYASNYLTMGLFGLSGPVTITPIAAGKGEKAKADRFSYKASFSYQPVDSITIYATVATGFRTPVVNARGGAASLVDPNDIVIPFGSSSDELINYELGLKGSWMDGALTANLAAYLIDWDNIQVQANRVSDSVQFVTNIGQARSQGVEFEITASPLDGLDLYLNGAYTDSRVTDLTAEEAAISGAVEGERLAAPYFQGSATAKYSFEVGADMTAFASATIAHVGSFPGLFPNVPGKPDQTNPTYDHTDTFNNVNVNFGVQKGDWVASGYVENLTDDHSVTYVHPEAFLFSRYGTLRPRTYGLRFARDF
ncbi:TonB-dependent receptor [Microbulbifer hydrolyticus]|uniref:Outer membrane receptor protein involved in Fe transport n=1 Tax=Microbulbifer hydrolyticus TaxID=48074 RepID=A0A6P1TCY4_9GAMM|nr:TonB-dependent receptor [Microbulbifer hydrolyticus]MBB5211990.1 outer membrane receptor protein involved in Fe transport [Microbulbifer hydrolyticus]QHQ39671.1 TonB-dependent receptor [Microbulbifer hydrolyticus]